LSGPLVYVDADVFIAGFEPPLEQAQGMKPPSGMTLDYPDRSGVDLILNTWSGQVQAPR
jgi:hypothetical protein